jgi:hypothetical protein
MKNLNIDSVGFDLLPDTAGDDKLYLTFTASVPLVKVGDGYDLRDAVLSHLRGLWGKLNNTSVSRSHPLTNTPEKTLYLLGSDYSEFIYNFTVGTIDWNDIRLLSFELERTIQDTEGGAISKYHFVRPYNFRRPDHYSDVDGASRWDIESPTHDFNAEANLYFNHRTHHAHVGGRLSRLAETGESVDGKVVVYGRLVITRDATNRPSTYDAS